MIYLIYNLNSDTSRSNFLTLVNVIKRKKLLGSTRKSQVQLKASLL